jgi:RES domain-containing protein
MPSEQLIAQLEAFPRTAFQGTCYRHAAPGYAPLSAEGARLHGGRWNPPNSFPVIYLGLDKRTVAREFYRLAARQGVPAEELLPRSLHAIKVGLTTVFELDTAQLGQLGLSVADIHGDDPDKCQEVGDAAHFLAAEGIVAPSATGMGRVLALFWDRLNPESRVEATGLESWTKLP